MAYLVEDIDLMLRRERIDNQPVVYSDRIVETIVGQYWAAIYRLACGMLGDPDEAEDAAQDTFVAAALNLGQYQVGTNFRAWLFTIAINTCRGVLRKRKTRQKGINLLQALHFSAHQLPGPEEAALQTLEGANLWAAVDQLGEKHRLVVILRIRHELTVQEISQILNIPEKTVYTRLYDAFRELRKRVKRS
jgi:RNA polymerase sigma-70 factor, ECF subfamily